MLSFLQDLHVLLGGASPITGYIGSAVLLLTIVNQVFVEQGLPHGVGPWITFLVGIGLRFAKDVNKSNAPSPSATATTVRS